jgi:hypothetical protein
LNELLLLLGFDRVGPEFFQFLVDGTTDYESGSSFRSFEALEAAVDRFEQMSLLRFGNVKYGFKTLSRDSQSLNEKLAELQEVPVERFAARHEPIRAIEPISPDRTYYLGYIIERELEQ